MCVCVCVCVCCGVASHIVIAVAVSHSRTGIELSCFDFIITNRVVLYVYVTRMAISTSITFWRRGWRKQGRNPQDIWHALEQV